MPAARLGRPVIRSACRRQGISRGIGKLADRRCARPNSASPLPFTGGWLIYLGYELASEIEPRLRLPRAPDPVTALAIRAPAAWIRDRATGQAWLVAEPGHESLLEEFESRVRTLDAPAPAGPAAFRIEEDEPQGFLASVRRALDYIAAGDVYQANLSRRWRATAEPRVDPVEIYRRFPGPRIPVRSLLWCSIRGLPC